MSDLDRLDDTEPRTTMTGLTRAAIWMGAVTLGVPSLWAIVVSLGGSFGLLVGWYGVLPMILLVPIGVVTTIVLGLAAVVQSSSRRATPDAIRSEDGPNMRMPHQQDAEQSDGHTRQ